MDGYITIGTKIDSSDLDGELKRLKKELSQYEKENQTLLKQKAKIELDTSQAEQKINEINASLEQIEIKKNSLALQQENAPKYSEAYFEAVEQLKIMESEEAKYMNQHADTLAIINQQETAMNDINAKLQDNVTQQQRLQGEIVNVNEELKQQGALDMISNKISSIIGKVTKWGLALFGIRGAYSMISRAMSTLSQQDKNMASQIQYIQWALANAIAPVVKFIISAVKLILDYINSIWRILFGHDLFKGPKEFAKSMKSASGSAQKIQKSLAGFDEMNILGDNTASAGGGGVSAPSFDFDTADVTKGLEKIKEKMKELKKTYVESTDDMGKALSNPKAFKLAYGNWDLLMMGIVKIVHSINTIVMGIGDVFGGVFKVIHGIVTGNLKEIIEGFVQMGKGISEIFRGLLGIIVGILMTIVGAIKGVIGTIYTLLKPIGIWIWNNVLQPILNFFSTAVGGIIKFFASIPGKIVGFFKDAKDKIMGVFGKETGKKIGTALADGLGNAIKSGINWVIDKINAFIGGLNKIKISVGGKDYGFNVKKIPRLAKGTILNNPGRGVPVGNAIAGEAGREAYLPLSDSQLLEELGSTIGRYITINLTNETKLDGRTIARKVSQLSNNDNFLRNR